MRRRLHSITAALTLAPAMAGCVQTTRHSNTMLFGTNTRFGISAGVSAGSLPEVNVGYARQEAVVMPLVANSRDNGTYQSPCDPSQPVQSAGAKFAVHPCLLVAVNGSVQDSYSVLASFGAKFDGSARTVGTQVSGGLAQYFATGVAAQLLALNGGASVVAVGEAATKSAETKPVTASTVEALFGNQADFARGVGYRDAYTGFRDTLLAKIELSGSVLATRMTAFEAATGTTGRGVAADCTSVAACKKSIADNDPYRDVYGPKKTSFDQALDAWKIP